MRILMLCHDMGIGGAQTHVYELCRSLWESGHTVTLLCSARKEESETARALCAHGVQLFQGNRLWKKVLWVRRLLRRAVKDGKPFDVLHVHTRPDAWVARLANGKGRKRLPIVMTVHADFCARGLRKVLSYFGDCALCVSGDLCRALQQNFRYPPDRIKKTVNAIDTARFAPMQNSSRIAGRVVCLCRMEADAAAGALALLDCAEALRRRFPFFTAEFLGSGRLLPSMMQKASVLNRSAGQDFLFFRGSVADPVPFLQQADLALVSSRACLESMACGCAVIVSGSYGFGGLFCAALEQTARATNFTFRKSPLPTPEATLQALASYFSRTEEEKACLRRYNRAFVVAHYPLQRLCADALDAYRFAREKPILLLGYYGFGNFGDEVSACAIRDALAKQGHAVTVVCANARKNSVRFGSKCVGRYRFRALKDCRALILGGGSVLQDETSLRSFLYYAAWIALAKKRGLRVLLYANGIGPICTRLGKWLLPRVLRGVRILCRDDASFALCQASGFDCARCEDATALLSVRGASFPRLCDLPLFYASDGDAVTAQSVLCRPFCIVAVRRGARYRAAIPESFWESVGVPILFTALQECDLPLCYRLAKHYGGFVCTLSSHAQMCALLAHPNLQKVYAQRYHILYYARRMGVPCTAICKSLKLQEFAGTF